MTAFGGIVRPVPLSTRSTDEPMLFPVDPAMARSMDDLGLAPNPFNSAVGSMDQSLKLNGVRHYSVIQQIILSLPFEGIKEQT